MRRKSGELAALLKDKKIFYVNIEKPDNLGSTEETVIEDLQGISCSVDGDIITFMGKGITASFNIHDKTQIFSKRTVDGEIVSTFAKNGGLQIKSNFG